MTRSSAGKVLMPNPRHLPPSTRLDCRLPTGTPVRRRSFRQPKRVHETSCLPAVVNSLWSEHSDGENMSGSDDNADAKYQAVGILDHHFSTGILAVKANVLFGLHLGVAFLAH